MTSMTILLTFIFCVINFPPTLSTARKKFQDLQTCTFVEMEDDYFGLFIENNTCENSTLKHFVGVCDLETLTQWTPCPFQISSTCCPRHIPIQAQPCDASLIAKQANCSCERSLKCRQLLPIPDFPTCLLGETSPKCTPVSRRSVRTAPVINNCIRCMTKHPDAGVASLNWRRVKRGEITPFSMPRFGIIKRGRMARRYSRPCLVDRKYGKYERSIRNRKVHTLKLTENERALERHSNDALFKILSKISVGRKLVRKRRQGKEEEIAADDDDEEEYDDDGNAGDDIAIEEGPDVETTTEISERSELLQQQQKDLRTKNFTADISDEDKSGHENNESLKKEYTKTIIILCGLLIVNL